MKTRYLLAAVMAALAIAPLSLHAGARARDIHYMGTTFNTCPSYTTGDACSIEESWDDAVPPDERVYTLTQVFHRCSAHQAILDASLQGILHEENTRASKAWNRAAAVTGKTYDEVHWEFTLGRTLKISFPGLTVSQNVKMQIQDWCDTNIGPGKVEVL